MTRKYMYLDSLVLQAMDRVRARTKPGKPFSKDAVLKEVMRDHGLTQGVDAMTGVAAFLSPHNVYSDQLKLRLQKYCAYPDRNNIRRAACITSKEKGRQWYFVRLMTKTQLRDLMELKNEGSKQYIAARNNLEKLYKQLELLPANATVNDVYDIVFPSLEKEGDTQRHDIAS